MRKVNLPTCMVQLVYNFTSTCVYTCGAMQYFMSKIMFLPVEIEIYMWPDMGISPRDIVYMTQDLAIEASYTIHENKYWQDKWQYT